MSFLLSALLMASAPPVSVKPLDYGWFRVTVIYKGGSVEASSQALLRLYGAAGRLCKGKGRPVGEGTLNVDDVPETAAAPNKRQRLVALSEEWHCGPAAPARP
jgi:hypothetical protein